MDFEKLKTDMQYKIRKQHISSSPDRSVMLLNKATADLRDEFIEIICEVLKEYEKRKDD